MCGICGIVSLGRAPVDPAGIEPMLDALVHRGPDSWGILEESGIVAGIRRLRVIDLESGDQPIPNEDGTVQVVFNGEIYNYRELRRYLSGKGHTLKTRSDTEVLVHLWEEEGPAFLERLDGMFAFCIHDRTRDEVFIARDRLGIKPLFYQSIGERLLFASEVAALLRGPGVDGSIDPAKLVDLFCLQYVPGSRTIHRGVLKLLPGHYIHVRRGRLEIRRYYRLPRNLDPAPVDEAHEAEVLSTLLDNAVRAQRVSDVPLGVFLSGGLDSTIIACLLTQNGGPPLKTFSVGFGEGEAFDERSYARLVSERFGTEHHELSVSAGDVARLLPAMMTHLDEPVQDPAMLPTFLLSRFARSEVTVVQTGEGADELFGGYRRHLYQQRWGWLGNLPGLASLGRLAQRSRHLPRRVGQALGALGQKDPVRNHIEWSSIIGGLWTRELFEPDAVAAFESDALEAFTPYFDETRDPLGGRLCADLSEWLPHNLLAKVDRATMAFSLEARVPYLDHPIVERVAQLPETMKIRGRQTKVLLRRAFRDRLPLEILGRPKSGFDLPLGAWIRGPLRTMACDTLRGDGPGRWPGLRAKTVRNMLELHLAGRQNYGLPLFNLLSIRLFLERHA